MRVFLSMGVGLLCALANAAAAAPAARAIPFKQDTSSTASLFSGGATGVLVISLIAIAAVLFIRKRFNLTLTPPAAGRARLMRVLETQRMGPRTLLAVVEFGGVHYLVAQSEHGVNCLAQAAPDAGKAATVAEEGA